MTRYVLAIIATGEIDASATFDPATAAYVAPAGMVAIASDTATAETHYVASGALVAYTGPQAAAKAARPDYDCDWSNVTFSWVDTRSLDQAKEDQRALIRRAREDAESAGFTWDGSTFYSDPRSETRIQGAVILAMLAVQAAQPFSIDWTLADDSTRTLDGADMIAVGQALGAHVDAIFVQERSLRAQIDAATTIEDVLAVVWT